MTTRARRDIQTAAAFLTTRVKSPDEDNWGKLKRVLKYLNGTDYLKLNLSVDNLGLLKWFVDRSHNIHWDCNGHGGAMFTMDKGATCSYSQKGEAEYQELDQNGVGGGQYIHARDSMDTLFHTESRIRSRMRWFVPRQHQYTAPHEKRMGRK